MSQMRSLSPKRALFAEFAAVAKALAHPHRLEILEQLAQGERNVDVLADRVELSIANASQHLKQLRRAGLVDARRDGKFVFYFLRDQAVLQLLASIHEVAENNLSEVERLIRNYYHNRDDLEAVSREELTRLLRKESVTIIDLRPVDEFDLGHLPTAVNIPFRDLKKRLSRLSRSGEVIAYCRGPYCIWSYEAVALLRKHGFSARRLVDGFPEWRAGGLPVVTKNL